MNIRKRSHITPATVVPGDRIQVVWREWDGTETVLIQDDITKPATYDEAFIFDDVIDGREAIGGGLIEARK